MKKTLSILLMVAMSMTLMAQIVLVPGKFTSKDGKGFVVVEQEGTQAELYNMVRANIITIFNNPYSVMSENKPSIITINGASSGIYAKKGLARMCPVIHYKINIYFKDGKIRFDAPYVIGKVRDENNYKVNYPLDAARSDLSGTCPLFKKNGEVRFKPLNEDIERYFNNLIFVLSHKIDKEKQGIPEDW